MKIAPASQPKPNVRISAAARALITAMVEKGLSRAEAAKEAGISDNWAFQLLKRPEVLALRTELMEVLRTSEASRCIFAVAKLAHGAQSERVRMMALEWLADVAQEGPVSRAVINHHHTGRAPGLVILRVPEKEVPRPPVVINGELIERPRPRVNMIGTPVPHPSLARKDSE